MSLLWNLLCLLTLDFSGRAAGLKVLRGACIRPCSCQSESRKPAWVAWCCTKHRTHTCAVMQRT